MISSHVLSRDRGQPLPLNRKLIKGVGNSTTNNGCLVGAGQVIKGWEEGLKGMCVGEKRILTIPPSMAYGQFAPSSPYVCRSHTLNNPGSRGFGSVIPPNSALVFDVELAGLDAKGPREEL